MIEAAIESVLDQDYPNLEHIVVDGGSTDGTVDILKKYPHLRVVSEPDQGVYDAINKGLRLARGEIIGHLNTDDFYEPGVFGEVARCFAEDAEIDMVYGGATVFREYEAGERRILHAYLSSLQTEPTLSNITLGAPIINARFFRRSFYDRIGPYRTTYRIAADREFLLRAVLAGVRSARINRVVYHYRQHDSALTLDQGSRFRNVWAVEHMAMAERHLRGVSLPSSARETIIFWHSREAAVAALLAIRRGRFVTAARYMWRGWRFDARYPLHLMGRSRARYVLKKLVTDPRWVWRKINQRVINRFVVLFLLKKLVTDPRWVWRKTLVRLGVRSRDAD